LHKTHNIGLTNLVFTNKSVSSSTIDDRVAAALTIKDAFIKKTPATFGEEETDQFFNLMGKVF